MPIARAKWDYCGGGHLPVDDHVDDSDNDNDDNDVVYDSDSGGDDN